MKIYNLLKVFAFSLVVFSCQKSDSNQPNIIYILADDLGYGSLGCYYPTEIKTPVLDNMAVKGMRFTQHYSGHTICAPSRGVLMTGLHTGHSKIRDNGIVSLDSRDTTVATLLKNAGYKTAAIGKWGLGEENTEGFPLKQGFDYFYGYLNQVKAHNYYPDYLWRNDQKVMLDNELVFVKEGKLKDLGSAAVVKKEYSHDLFTSEALNFIEESAEDPFFLYLPYTIPHANNEHWLINEHGMEVPDYGQYADKDWPEAQKGLAAMISRMDRDVGRIIEKLQELGIEKNTLLIFTSDNGATKEGLADYRYFKSNGDLRGRKRDLYEGGIRVPMIAYWPGTIEAGQTSDHISAFWDFLPTACDVAGIEAPENIDGISFLPEITDKEQQKHELLYWEFVAKNELKQAVRKGDWKLIKIQPKNNLADIRFELYNLKDDISEKNDVSGEHPEIVSELKVLMNREHIPSDYFPFPGED